MAASIERKHPFGGWIVQNRVGMVAHLHLAQALQRLRIEDVDHALPAGADEAFAELRRERNTVHAGCIRDLAFQLAGVDINHHDARRTGNVEAAGSAVDSEVIPSSLSTQ